MIGIGTIMSINNPKSYHITTCQAVLFVKMISTDMAIKKPGKKTIRIHVPCQFDNAL